MNIKDMANKRIGHEPYIWHPVCVPCKKVDSKIGYTDEPNLTCSDCGDECEDANDMIASGKMTMTFDVGGINEGMARGKSLGECL